MRKMTIQMMEHFEYEGDDLKMANLSDMDLTVLWLIHDQAS